MPLVTLQQASDVGTAPTASQISSDGVVSKRRTTYRALYRKVTNKKHKTWDGDGTIVVGGGFAELKNEKGKYLGRTKRDALEVGEGLSVGGMEVEVGEVVEGEAVPQNQGAIVEEVVKPVFRKPATTLSRIPAEVLDAARTKAKTLEARHVLGAKPKAFVNPLSHSSALSRPDANGSGPASRHDPNAEGALVMQRPTAVDKGKQLVDVVVDPLLTRRLREHQRAGVAFMYECVMGMRCREGAGAILADEMGLGKSLQTITLLWTLLKQNPIHGEGPVVRKAIIICPASVTKNWRKEFRKWLGNERVGVLLLDDQKKIRSFTRGKSYQVLVVGYEMFNLIHKDLQKCNEIDIIVADEGHRLKTAKNKTAAAIQSLDVERRIVLTGTLLQNDYSEWYSVVDFVNPGYLGKYTSFKKDFETPILRARQQGSSPEDLEKGEEADRELKRQTGAFILRRTAEILTKYLPPKTEYVLLCRPTKVQAQVYNTLLSSGTLSAALRSPELSLQLISLLKKACNSPSLLASDPGTSDPESFRSQLTASFPPTLLAKTTTSGKVRVLDSLLHKIRTTTNDKVVIMSNYTSTLDVLASVLTSLDYRFSRLDGSTPSSKRQDLVDAFNSSTPERQFCFLMSTKAGGVGLNLTGASRLILFDLDWNPALDMQAMARTHRDGQKKECYIYRLVTKGALEEKIFQRQCSKSDLAGAVVDDRRSVAAFSQDVLRDLFRLDQRETCATHDALGCGCKGDGAFIEESDGTETESPASLDEEEDDEPPPKRMGFRPASEFDKKKAEASPAPKGSEMRGLMLYRHLDVRAWRKSRSGIEEGDDGSDGGCEEAAEAETDVIGDTVLRSVIVEEDSAVDYMFIKRSRDVEESVPVVVADAVGDGSIVVVDDE
ncbi:hypothetical protein ANO11243_053910 [Dothideomycetidae sp. 11243]|nr:hypothetical protein ANO11243_053910 [fungal sp. No.11243]